MDELVKTIPKPPAEDYILLLLSGKPFPHIKVKG